VDCFKIHKYPPPESFLAGSNHNFRFEIITQSTKSQARVGRIYTPHGPIDTPGFVPVGTTGTLKHLSTLQIQELNTQLIFCNTYHLLIHPGVEVIHQTGGLHQFINYHKPIITDSGGFQVSFHNHSRSHNHKEYFKLNAAIFVQYVTEKACVLWELINS
jgi:tRNA-guanine family transglycosylase